MDSDHVTDDAVKVKYVSIYFTRNNTEYDIWYLLSRKIIKWIHLHRVLIYDI